MSLSPADDKLGGVEGGNGMAPGGGEDRARNLGPPPPCPPPLPWTDVLADVAEGAEVDGGRIGELVRTVAVRGDECIDDARVMGE